MDLQVCDKKKSKGYITIYVVVILSGLVLGVLFAHSYIFAGYVNSDIVLLKEKKSRAISDACAETALMEVSRDGNFVGSGNLNFDGGECSYNVFDVSGLKEIQIEAIYENSYSRAKIIISQVNPIILQSWQYVSDF